MLLTLAETPREIASILDLLLAGGPLMLPIALSSVIALTYFFERWFRLGSAALGSDERVDELLAIWRARGADALAAEAEADGTPFARVIGAALGRVRPVTEVEHAYEDAARRELRRNQARLRPLVVVAMIAPLLGLLGTVWGMIQAFADIAGENGLGDPKVLATGISQALVTTAAGLAVAIPAQAAVHWFRSRIDRFQRRLEDRWMRLEPELEAPVGEAA
ncbi:MAG: MotA/TolQ/ExbB proton channel family protein [Planctomycetota bacterium]